MEKHLHIIAFNIPYPPNYGGIIDIYYKIKSLHQLGVKIILHCFEYEREHASALNDLCEKVYYYQRKTGLIANLTYLPYNVYSRKHPELLQNLLKDNHPILFEGLHSCYYMADKRLKNRKKIFRVANIEHDYYLHLAKDCTNLIKKSFFLIEALRFKAYQQVACHADLILAVSMTDKNYLKTIFPEKKVCFIPCFHAYEKMMTQPGQADFVFYHGKLSVPENEKAALFLIENVFRYLPYTCIIAGMNPSTKLLKAAAPFSNIQIEANPSSERMEQLITEAQIHMLITFQDTGLKLKLLYSLFAGRHVIVNKMMLAGSGLEPVCHIADTPERMIIACEELMQKEITTESIANREKYLFPTFSNKEQGEWLYKLIYEEN